MSTGCHKQTHANTLKGVTVSRLLSALDMANAPSIGQALTLPWHSSWAAIPGDSLTRAVVILGALVLGRRVVAVALLALRGAAGHITALGRWAGAFGEAIRPGIVRRLVAASLGLAIPTLASVGTAGASPLVKQSATAAGAPWVSAAPRGVAPQPSADHYVRVRPGDTLWDIAARGLPSGATAAAIARAWPRWYRANRQLIGPDPSLIRPGTRLRVPDLRSAGTSTSQHLRPQASSDAPGAVARSLDPDRR